MSNRRVKFGLKSPNRLGKNVRKFQGGDFFDSHCIWTLEKIWENLRASLYSRIERIMHVPSNSVEWLIGPALNRSAVIEQWAPMYGMRSSVLQRLSVSLLYSMHSEFNLRRSHVHVAEQASNSLRRYRRPGCNCSLSTDIQCSRFVVGANQGVSSPEATLLSPVGLPHLTFTPHHGRKESRRRLAKSCFLEL